MYRLFLAPAIFVGFCERVSGQFCGDCALTDGDPMILLTVVSSSVPAISTIYTITNQDGITTSTFFNITASSLVSSLYAAPNSMIYTGDFNNEYNTIEGINGLLEYETVSVLGNGGTTCVPASADVSDSAYIIFTGSDDFSSSFSMILAQALSGQPVPPSCAYEPEGIPIYQVPGQFLTQNIQINNLPTTQPNPNTTPNTTPTVTTSQPAAPSTTPSQMPVSTTSSTSSSTSTTPMGNAASSSSSSETTSAATGEGSLTGQTSNSQVVVTITQTGPPCATGSGPGYVIMTAMDGGCVTYVQQGSSVGTLGTASTTKSTASAIRVSSVALSPVLVALFLVWW